MYLYISYSIFTAVHGNFRARLQIASLEDISMYLTVCGAEYIDTTTGGIMHTSSHTNVCNFFNFQLTFSQMILYLKC